MPVDQLHHRFGNDTVNVSRVAKGNLNGKYAEIVTINDGYLDDYARSTTLSGDAEYHYKPHPYATLKHISGSQELPVTSHRSADGRIETRIWLRDFDMMKSDHEPSALKPFGMENAARVATKENVRAEGREPERKDLEYVDSRPQLVIITAAPTKDNPHPKPMVQRMPEYDFDADWKTNNTPVLVPLDEVRQVMADLKAQGRMRSVPNLDKAAALDPKKEFEKAAAQALRVLKKEDDEFGKLKRLAHPEIDGIAEVLEAATLPTDIATGARDVVKEPVKQVEK